ncbi:unnamed protein product [Effrenium voratum]|nr:unnamed protein product [Effrenium voratum]
MDPSLDALPAIMPSHHLRSAGRGRKLPARQPMTASMESLSLVKEVEDTLSRLTSTGSLSFVSGFHHLVFVVIIQVV